MRGGWYDDDVDDIDGGMNFGGDLLLSARSFSFSFLAPRGQNRLADRSGDIDAPSDDAEDEEDDEQVDLRSLLSIESMLNFK